MRLQTQQKASEWNEKNKNLKICKNIVNVVRKASLIYADIK